MVALSDLQEAAGIKRVVWIDDAFAEPPDDALRVAILAKLRVLHENGQSPRHNAFRGINVDAPDSIRDRQIDTALNNLVTDKYPRLLECLTRQANECGLQGDPEEDLTPGQVVGLRDGLQNVTVFPYRTWQSAREDLLADAGSDTLFLVDREFSKEGLGDDIGDDIVEEIVGKAPKAYCVVFTHKVGADTVDNLKAEVVKKSSVEAHQFGVMSKRGLGDGVSDVVPHFSRALRMCLLCRFCCEVALKACGVMNTAAIQAAREMASFSVESIDAAIFENSLREGASEFDVVECILAVNQRSAFHRALATKSDSFARLQRIRKVRALVSDDPSAINGATEPKLHAWRIAEVVDEGEYVNALHSPLRCGDIFRNTRDNRRYILLAQPCDLVVRGSGADFGKRRRDEAELVFLEESDPDVAKRETNFVLKGLGRHGEAWLVNFREAISVNLRVLDLAVFNSEGRVEWKLGQQAAVQLLPGWRERFRVIEEALGGVRNPDAMSALSHSDSDHDFCGVFEDSTYSFPLERTGRIRSPYAEAIQASYAAFISRAALSHDFANSLWIEKSEPDAN